MASRWETLVELASESGKRKIVGKVPGTGPGDALILNTFWGFRGNLIEDKAGPMGSSVIREF
jgi:hypothetical protein